jgi:16S rRNA (guanine527-N7)-methyltransferase
VIASEEEARTWLEALPGVDGSAVLKLERLAALLGDENQRQNLVAQTSLASIWQRHFADSAQLLTFVPRGTSLSWLDLGTGAGFPGLVVAILRPDLRITLVESRRRRVEWLDRIVTELALVRVEVRGVRVEDLSPTKFDVISARAFAPLARLLDLSARFSTADTLWLLPKGRSAAQEVQELRGWNHTFHVEQSLTQPDAGIVVGHLLGRKGRTT